MKKLTPFLIIGICLSIATDALAAFPQANILNVQSSAIEGPAHHGLVVQTSGITDPSLSFYEVSIKPDSGGPFPPWATYNTEIQPYDSALLVIPYRDGIFSMRADTRYCVRVRAVYGSQTTAWAQRCGIQINVPASPAGDSDRDGLSDADEYARGLDPNNRDVDGDGLSDGLEVGEGSDPEQEQVTRLVIRQPILNFGDGNRFGTRANQHQYLEIENVGDAPARLNFFEIPEGEDVDFRDTFKWGALPEFIPAIAPQNIVRIPIDFHPVRRGPINGSLQLNGNTDQPLPAIQLSGNGVGFADCQINPYHLDFGTVAVNDQNVLTRSFTIANLSGNDDLPPNRDAPLVFTLSSSDSEMVMPFHRYRLGVGEEIEVPVVFTHLTAGEHNGAITVQSPDCGIVNVEFQGTAQ